MPIYEYDAQKELDEILEKIEILERFVEIPENQSDVPIGVIVAMPTAGGLDSTWRLCNGSALSRANFPDLNSLYSADGYPFGNGNGSTTFNVPNLVGRIPLAKAGSGTGSTLGGTGGSWSHSHSVPSHSHGSDGGHTLSSAGTAHTHSSGGAHSHGTAGSHSESQEGHNHTQGNTLSDSSFSHTHSLTTVTAGHTHVTGQSLSFSRAGIRTSVGTTANMARQPHAHLAPNQFIVSHSHGSSASSPGSHTHSNPTTSNQNHTHGSGGSHNHGSADSHNHGSAGSSHSHGTSAGGHTHPSATPSIGSANPPVTAVTWWVKARNN